MRKSEKYELVILADQALDKAYLKFDEVVSELEEKEDFKGSNLATTISDSLKNLSRKIDAYMSGKIHLEKLVDEFLFEHEIIEDELEIGKEEPVRLKRLAKRLLSSYEDFINKVGGRKKLKLIEKVQTPILKPKSKATAYLLWFFGFFGVLGLHRFYLGKIGTGFGWLLSGGILGLGALYDLFALGGMVDNHNAFVELRTIEWKQLKGEASTK